MGNSIAKFETGYIVYQLCVAGYDLLRGLYGRFDVVCSGDGGCGAADEVRGLTRKHFCEKCAANTNVGGVDGAFVIRCPTCQHTKGMDYRSVQVPQVQESNEEGMDLTCTVTVWRRLRVRARDGMAIAPPVAKKQIRLVRCPACRAMMMSTLYTCKACCEHTPLAAFVMYVRAFHFVAFAPAPGGDIDTLLLARHVGRPLFMLLVLGALLLDDPYTILDPCLHVAIRVVVDPCDDDPYPVDPRSCCKLRC